MPSLSSEVHWEENVGEMSLWTLQELGHNQNWVVFCFLSGCSSYLVLGSNPGHPQESTAAAEASSPSPAPGAH